MLGVLIINFPLANCTDTIYILVDTSRAGKGELRLEVRGQVTSPDTTMKSDGHGRYRVTFVPQEGSRHYAIVHFGDDVVKGESIPAHHA